MSDVIRSLFLCSLIMGILTVGYHLFLRRFGTRYKAVWRYHLWFIIVLGFLFFLKPAVLIPEVQRTVAQSQDNHNWVTGIVMETRKENTIKHWMEEWGGTALFAVWICVAAGTAIYFVWEYGQFRGTVRKLRKRAVEPCYEAVLEEEKKRIHVRGNHIRLAVLPCIDSPMLTGFLHPFILLPDIELSEEELHLMIRHELTHYRRKDTWWKLAALAVRCIHWFNPIAYRIQDWMDIECESACDEAVLAGESEAVRILYGGTLLKMIRQKTTCKSRLATAFQGKKSSVQVRFMEILEQGKRKSLIFGALILFVAAVGSGTYTVKGQNDISESMVGEVMETSSAEWEYGSYDWEGTEWANETIWGWEEEISSEVEYITE